jgi:IS1 family transposase
MVSMNKLNTEKRTRVVSALVEGCSIRSTVCMTGVAKNTVTKLLVKIGEVCSDFQNEALRNLSCRRLQLDEIWSFVGAKAKNVPAERQGQFGIGDVWTWVAIDADTKLVPSWFVGTRDGDCADAFVNDLSKRLTHRVQITSDGLKSYLDAVEGAFGGNVDFAQLIKLYGKDESPKDTRYSPPNCIGCRPRNVTGHPDPSHVSTSFVERQNLTMRMNMRRFTRLTNAFSKKVENHARAIALHFMHYNFARIHQTLKSTPAMRAGVTDHLWSIEEIVGLLETKEGTSN